MKKKRSVPIQVMETYLALLGINEFSVYDYLIFTFDAKLSTKVLRLGRMVVALLSS